MPTHIFPDMSLIIIIIIIIYQMKAINGVAPNYTILSSLLLLPFYHITKVYKENMPGFPVESCTKHKVTIT